MPMYRFLMSDGDQSTDFVELPDLERARIEAVRTIGDRLRHDSEEFWADGGWQLVVQDEDAMTLFEIDAVATIAPALKRG